VIVAENLRKRKDHGARDTLQVVDDALHPPAGSFAHGTNPCRLLKPNLTGKLPAGHQIGRQGGQKVGIDFGSLLSANQGHVRLVVTNFPLERWPVRLRHVGWIRHHEIKRRRSGHGVQPVALDQPDALRNAMAPGIGGSHSQCRRRNIHGHNLRRRDFRRQGHGQTARTGPQIQQPPHRLRTGADVLQAHLHQQFGFRAWDQHIARYLKVASVEVLPARDVLKRLAVGPTVEGPAYQLGVCVGNRTLWVGRKCDGIHVQQLPHQAAGCAVRLIHPTGRQEASAFLDEFTKCR